MLPLHVLLVGRSAVAREAAAAHLRRAGIRVTTTPDARAAVKRLDLARPDVLVIDLSPSPDGELALIRQVMRARPLPILVVDRGGDATRRALDIGAVGVLPAWLVLPDVPEPDGARELASRVRGAVRQWAPRQPEQRQPEPRRGRTGSAQATPAARPVANGPRLIAIGASTGGTQAVEEVLTQLPADSPPVLVVIHMPAEFTGAFARHLDSRCRIAVTEARTGERLQRGQAFVAPGDHHMEVHRRGDDLLLSLHQEPPVSGHRPSVDVLLHSVARSCGSRAVGVVLTGMGRDGADGLLAVHSAGGVTFVQDETSSVVFGMGREAIRLGAADRVLPLAQIGGALLMQR